MANKDYEFTDHLKEHMRGRIKRFLDNMGLYYPPELLSTSKGRLIDLIEERATPILRGIEDSAIRTAAFETLIAIRWAERNPASKFTKES